MKLWLTFYEMSSTYPTIISRLPSIISSYGSFPSFSSSFVFRKSMKTIFTVSLFVFTAKSHTIMRHLKYHTYVQYAQYGGWLRVRNSMRFFVICWNPLLPFIPMYVFAHLNLILKLYQAKYVLEINYAIGEECFRDITVSNPVYVWLSIYGNIQH